jgi:hypothetical protein
LIVRFSGSQVLWETYQTEFIGTSGQSIPHIFFTTRLPGGAKLTLRIFVVSNRESFYMYDTNLTSSQGTLKFGMDIEGWTRTWSPGEPISPFENVYFTTCSFVFAFEADDIIQMKTLPDDFPREFNASAAYQFSAELPTRSASVIFRFPPLASIDRRNTHIIGLGFRASLPNFIQLDHLPPQRLKPPCLFVCFSNCLSYSAQLEP